MDDKVGDTMKLKKAEAEKKYKDAIKKGYSAKLGADYLVIITKKGREEFEVK